MPAALVCISPAESHVGPVLTGHAVSELWTRRWAAISSARHRLSSPPYARRWRP